MKKILSLAVAAAIMLCGSTLCWAQDTSLPAPFEKARELALSAPVDPEVGSRCFRVETNEAGQAVTYNIWYHKDHPVVPDQIVLQKKGRGTNRSVAYHLQIERRSAYREDAGWTPISQEQCLKIGFEFFRELVAKGLI